MDGILVVDKPPGPTSHTVVAQARRYFGQARVGHAGTLDPFASGVLILLLGEATKLSGYLTQAHKLYRATVRFGFSTDTLDETGEVLESLELAPGFPDAQALDDALERERRRLEQVPPRVSAIKVQGRRAYQLARAQQDFELAPRPVAVQHLMLRAREGDAVALELSVSKGYYVRALARDLGATLGVPAHLASLRRLGSGCFTAAESCPWPPADEELARGMVLDLNAGAKRAMPCATLTSLGVRKAQCGQLLLEADFLQQPSASELPTGWFDPVGRLVAIGRCEQGNFRVSRGFGAGQSVTD